MTENQFNKIMAFLNWKPIVVTKLAVSVISAECALCEDFNPEESLDSCRFLVQEIVCRGDDWMIEFNRQLIQLISFSPLGMEAIGALQLSPKRILEATLKTIERME
ncbi:hypothetical protein M0R72_18105 [Candidatus Pacearchaeota archaeon]|jgi:hypothetical protein|nr:hypothetical protein [Candidatus Pacearchaeota archaeon]